MNIFDKTFKNKESEIQNIPKEIMDILKSKPLKGFNYEHDNDGRCVLISEKTPSIPINIPKYISNLTQLQGYLYRTQQRLEVNPDENGYININDNRINIERLINDNLKANNIKGNSSNINDKMEIRKIQNLCIIPSDFPPPFRIEFKIGSFKSDFLIKRMPSYDNNILAFQSVDKRIIKISYAVNEKTQSMKLRFNFDIKRASSSCEVVNFIEYYNEFLKGVDIYINGNKIKENLKISSQKGFEKTLRLWKNINDLEKSLGVKFIPASNIEEDDWLLINELYYSLVKFKPCKEYSNNYELPIQCSNKEKDRETLLKNNIMIITTGEVSVELLGVNFKVFVMNMLFDAKIISVDDDENSEENCIIKFEPVKDKKIYVSKKYYINKSDMEEDMKKSKSLMEEFKNAIDILSENE